MQTIYHYLACSKIKTALKILDFSWLAIAQNLAKSKSERAAKTFVKFAHFVLQFCKFFKSYCRLSSLGKNEDNFWNTICSYADHKNHHFQSNSFFKFRYQYENIKMFIYFPTTAFIFPILPNFRHKSRHSWGSLASNI